MLAQHSLARILVYNIIPYSPIRRNGCADADAFCLYKLNETERSRGKFLNKRQRSPLFPE